MGRGHNGDALTVERGAELTSLETVCPWGVTDLFETFKYVVKSDSNESRDVFANDPVGVELVDDAEHFRPEISVVVGTSLFSSDGEWLTGKSSGDNGWSGMYSGFLIKALFRKCSDISPPWHGRPVLFQNGRWVIGEFALPNRLEPRPLCGKIQPPNAGKKGKVGQCF